MSSKNSVTFVTLTQFTTIPPAKATSIITSIITSSHSASLTLSFSTLPFPTTQPTLSTIPHLPSQFATPTPPPFQTSTHSGPTPVNNNIVAVTLACIAAFVVLFILLLALILYERCKGRCANCKNLEGKIKRLEEGTQVTVASVRARESVRTQADGPGTGRESRVTMDTIGEDTETTELGRQMHWAGEKDSTGVIRIAADDNVRRDSENRATSLPQSSFSPPPPPPKNNPYTLPANHTRRYSVSPPSSPSRPHSESPFYAPLQPSDDLGKGYRDSVGAWHTFIDPYPAGRSSAYRHDMPRDDEDADAFQRYAQVMEDNRRDDERNVQRDGGYGGLDGPRYEDLPDPRKFEDVDIEDAKPTPAPKDKFDKVRDAFRGRK
ncbi:hypothetical protein K469DRAFT_769835 [Zopfia rhizophila CBS 207.26]|uniref:Uncharacterized protein n=1 Tax=Zopfia rhizophila CBS 207.26 TaxID=1314779 RepID=A0A6A6EBL0_9PEZI|nr:hypothetical protein K469DRAFT_769835 [Zopfia rhizophila CBS 207.26]